MKVLMVYLYTQTLTVNPVPKSFPLGSKEQKLEFVKLIQLGVSETPLSEN